MVVAEVKVLILAYLAGRQQTGSLEEVLAGKAGVPETFVDTEDKDGLLTGRSTDKLKLYG